MIHNHPILHLLVLMLAVTFLLSCTTASPPDTSVEDSRSIKTASIQFADAFNQGDAASVAALYTLEAKLLQPNGPMIIGGESIQAMFQGWFDAGVGDLQPTVIDLHVNGDMAYIVGKYSLTIQLQPEEGEAISDSGKYVEIWKRENGSWKIDVDIFNSSVPLPAPEEEEAEEEL